VLEQAFAPVVTNLYTAFSDIQRTNPAGLMGSVSTIIGDSANGLGEAINGLNGSGSNPNCVFGQLEHALTDVDETATLFLDVLRSRRVETGVA